MVMDYRSTHGPGKGFTLIELMIAVAVLALLTLIALPSYEGHLQRIRRAEAKTFVLGIAQQLERCYSRYGSYTHDSCSVGRGPLVMPAGYYKVVITNLSQATFSLTATPQGQQSKDTQCRSLVLDHLGQHTATGSLGNQCWDR